jgi:peroxiredoxin Q/BCP
MMKTIQKTVFSLANKVTFQKHTTKLKPGDLAPEISGVLQDGTPIDMKQYAGKKIVLYFYPKDNTPACTAQACSLRDNYKLMLEAGYVVIGVSADSTKKHQNFIAKYQLPFPLIADVDMKLIKAYDVWGEKQFMGRIFNGIIRSTFVIDEKGIIKEVISNVDAADHAEQIMHSPR